MAWGHALGVVGVCCAVGCSGRNATVGRTGPARNVQVEAGIFHTCGLSASGYVTCWGGNDYGQADPPLEGGFVEISSGYQHSCARRADGTAVCWGSNLYGQLEIPLDRAFTSVVAGYDRTCVVDGDDKLDCYGRALPPRDLSEGVLPVTKIAVGEMGVCGLTEEGKVLCTHAPDWQGEGFVSVSVGFSQRCAGHENGHLLCQEAGAPSAPESGDFVMVSSAGYNSCALHRDGGVDCWYKLRAPELLPEGPFTWVTVGGEHACGLRVDGTAACWGHDGDGRLDPVGDFAQ